MRRVAAEHEIFNEDSFLDYPQSRGRILGRQNIQITRGPSRIKSALVVRRIVGSGDLWITAYALTYDDCEGDVRSIRAADLGAL
jgi:hypothetical protein